MVAWSLFFTLTFWYFSYDPDEGPMTLGDWLVVAGPLPVGVATYVVGLRWSKQSSSHRPPKGGW